MSFFDTEEAHAVMLEYAAYGGGLPCRDNTGILSCFAASWVWVALNKVFHCQVWARGVLL
jgi:hypothetical protein